MLTQARIDVLKGYPGIGWISALKSRAIRDLVDTGDLQLSLFDTTNLAEITAPEYPGERLIACFNPLLAEERRRKRQELIEAAQGDLQKIVAQVQRRSRRPLTASEIGQKVGKVINRYKVGKHFVLTIQDGLFQCRRNEESIEREMRLDGIYVVRTSEPAAEMSAADTVRQYKSLSEVERAFRCLKGVDLLVRPIRHFTADHVRAHIFLCMLAYYVEWHMREALAPLLFDDEHLQELRLTRDPVAPAQPSESARKKKARRTTEDGLPIHSFQSLLAELATRCRHRCRIQSQPDAPTFVQHTEYSPFQERAMQLLGLLPGQKT
jgi:hypothetical protein